MQLLFHSSLLYYLAHSKLDTWPRAVWSSNDRSAWHKGGENSAALGVSRGCLRQLAQPSPSVCFRVNNQDVAGCSGINSFQCWLYTRLGPFRALASESDGQKTLDNAKSKQTWSHRSLWFHSSWEALQVHAQNGQTIASQPGCKEEPDSLPLSAALINP